MDSVIPPTFLVSSRMDIIKKTGYLVLPYDQEWVSSRVFKKFNNLFIKYKKFFFN